MSTSEKGVGIAALIMAVCCAVLPLAGGALAGGLAFGAGTIGIVAAVVIIAAVLAFVLRRRRGDAGSSQPAPSVAPSGSRTNTSTE